MTRVTAVLFDLGGTLFTYDQRELIRRPGLVALQRLGLDTDDPHVIEQKRLASEEVESEYAELPAFLHRDLFRDRVARTAERLGVTATADVLDQFDAENRQAIVDHLVPRPDAVPVLTDLRNRGIYAAIVSNADEDYLNELVARHELGSLLVDWTSSEAAQSCKPDARIYEHALHKAARPAAETLFVGDSLEHDVAGAHLAGMRTVLIGDPGTKAPLSSGLNAGIPPDHTVSSLFEVLTIVNDANARS